jgi:hypothetical protein
MQLESEQAGGETLPGRDIGAAGRTVGKVYP